MPVMAGEQPIDPAAFFREVLGQWEQMANEYGGNLLKTGEFSRVMHGANSAALRAREVGGEMMERALAAAQMPSVTDIANLSERLRLVEESLQRVESMLRTVVAAQGINEPPPVATPPRPKPKRTRKPPSQAKGNG